jgi:hypothetical protein
MTGVSPRAPPPRVADAPVRLVLGLARENSAAPGGVSPNESKEG